MHRSFPTTPVTVVDTLTQQHPQPQIDVVIQVNNTYMIHSVMQTVMNPYVTTNKHTKDADWYQSHLHLFPATERCFTTPNISTLGRQNSKSMHDTTNHARFRY